MLEPKVKPTKINSIEIWTDVFIVYMSVYCSIHTTKFQELLKYMNSIRLGAKRCSGDDWLSYDQQYRLKKAKDPSSSWSTIDYELWLIYMQSASLASGTIQNINRASTLKCYSFNYNGVCSKFPCFYQHRCNDMHPLIRCFKQSETLTPRFNSSAVRYSNRFSTPSSGSSFRSQHNGNIGARGFRPRFQTRGNGNFRPMGLRQNTR